MGRRKVSSTKGGFGKGGKAGKNYYGSSITDERHFALYIKDTIDDEDAGDGTTMRRWYATMVANGTMVDWEDVI